MTKWKQTSIGEFIDFNPTESIKKGTLATKVGMDKLGTFQRKINGSEKVEYNGGPKFRNTDTVVAKITPCLENGKTAYVDILEENEVAFGSSEFIVLRKNECSDSKFIYYLARSPLFREKAISCMEGTSGRKRVNEGALKRQEILIPSSVTQQQKIASILSSLDDKIELNSKINDNLERMAKTLYDYWFVQFDFPDENGKPYKSSGGKMICNEVLKREIPEGWEVKKLNDCIEQIIDYRGKTPKKLDADWSTDNSDIIAISAKHIKKGKLINLSEANRVNNSLYHRWMKDKLIQGDILMTSEAPCGEFFYLIGDTEYCLSQRVFAIRSDIKILSHTYLYYELSIGNGYSQILGKVSGSTVFGIRQDELRTVYVLIPNMSLQKKFEKQILPLYHKIRINERQNQQLSSLRDWLLPMLMNGQVKVE
ncbi:restriction endonuclease subunit S [Elizabethkingia anophelis]|uniref:restriction endonuclease subunit S n=1 Tax=Elizabethkingia anophelis TaxID=1117645 RepID=UPI00402998FF